MKPRLERVAIPVFVGSLFFLESGCSSTSAARTSSRAPVTASSDSHSQESLALADAARAAYEKARAIAWSPRRFKALFKAEVSPKAGAVGRGFFSVWWDGSTLAWRSSAPLAGAGRGGFLRKKGMGQGAAVTSDAGAPSDGAGSLLPGKLSAEDVIASILGVPDTPLSPSVPFEEKSGTVRLFLDGFKRSALFDKDRKLIELVFPGDERVRLGPGEGVPRRIEAKGPDGRATLKLESFGPWPEGEPVPPV